MTVVCSLCSKHFSKNSNLTRHIARVHSETRTSEHSKPSTTHSFICDYCNQIFSRKQNLKRHFLVHTSTFDERRKIVCMYCMSNGVSKKFVTRKLLQEHCVKVHDVELREEIKTFSSKSGRKNKFRMQLSILM